MILHIVQDEKFIDKAYRMFEKVSPGNNKFIMESNKQKEFKYIKNTPITVVSRYKFLSKKFAQSLAQYDFIIFHAIFTDDYLQLAMNADKNIKFVWIGWGSDYNFIYGDLYLKKTSKLYQSISKENKSSIKEEIKQKIKQFINKRIFLRDVNDREKAINRINYFAPVLEEEYVLVKKSFKNFKPKFIDWNYGSVGDSLGGCLDKKINGNNILIGNSASFENNHLEAFDKVKKLNIGKRKIIVPLSYGNEIYGREIIKYGQKMFGDHFYPLVDFMSIIEYHKIISSCSIVVMNHLRQEATGNVTIMLYLGAKIFLNTENQFFQFLKNSGAIIFTMDELNNENICNNLTDEEVEVNRNILRNFIDEDVILTKTKNLIDIVMKDER